jgi:hypothetical protein
LSYAPKYDILSPTDKKYILSILALDDFGDVAVAGFELAQKYGPQIYDYLKTEWSKRKSEPLSELGVSSVKANVEAMMTKAQERAIK